jgi:hypothetical protein
MTHKLSFASEAAINSNSEEVACVWAQAELKEGSDGEFKRCFARSIGIGSGGTGGGEGVAMAASAS